MNNKEAIKILQDELKHTEFHLNDKNKADEFYEEMKLYCEAFRLAIKALEMIDNAPTVEALKDIAEVHCDITKEQLLNALRPKGEWKEHYENYICSECGQVVGKFKKNYCPTCGADMRGTNNDVR